MHGEKVELVRHLAFRMADMDLVKYRDENVKHWHISSESVKYFRGRNLRICFFLFTFTLSKLFGPSHYSRFSASTCYEFIHVRQRVHVYFIPGNWYGRRKGGSPTTSAVNRRSITTFRRREHRHARDVRCLLAATQIRKRCLVSNITTFSDKLTSVVFRWKHQRTIMAYQNSIHTHLWRQYSKTAVSHSILHEAR